MSGPVARSSRVSAFNGSGVTITRSSIVGPHTEALLRRPLVAIGVIALVLVAAATISYVLRIGPVAPPAAAPSVVFVAISRSTDETDAHEIEAIDLAAGIRQLFDAGGRILAMAIAPDRRSLYVALDGGRIVFLDATTGSAFGRVDRGARASPRSRPARMAGGSTRSR